MVLPNGKEKGRHFLFSKLKAAKQDNDILVQWTTEYSDNTCAYEVQRSADGLNFSSIHNVPATANTTYGWKDTDPLPGTSYYRIHNVDKGMGSSYSNRAMVPAVKEDNTITVYPNPLRNSLLGIQLNNALAGTYALRLYNLTGQLIWKNDISNEGLSNGRVLKLPAGIAKGIYKLNITMPDGTFRVKQVFID